MESPANLLGLVKAFDPILLKSSNEDYGAEITSLKPTYAPSGSGTTHSSIGLSENFPTHSHSNSSASTKPSSFTSTSSNEIALPLPLKAFIPSHINDELISFTSPGVSATHTPRPQNHDQDKLAYLVQSIAKKDTAQPTAQLQARGKQRMKLSKYGMTLFLVTLNFFFIFSTWWFSKFYYLFLPFISLPLVLNCAMIASIIFFTTKHKVRPERTIIPESPESLVLLMPCYNETLEECTKSLDSLVEQVNIDQHKKAIMVICDGRVRGPGMAKTTAQYLMDDILIRPTARHFIRKAYLAWDNQYMDIEVSKGTYKGIPFFCIVKQQNQGKRDSLIVIRSFLYNFNRREQHPQVIFSPEFFSQMASFLVIDASISNVVHLIGMDADTIFDPTCISELLKESRYPHTVGVCGYVAVDFKSSNWSAWSLYQSTEYTISQGLRRLHQSIATHKVSCLPGCCQLLRICSSTCGDEILLQKFGYCPGPLDSMLKQIRATASEDRNHVCLMLTTFPKAQTRQALKARAYTDVPHSWSIFLSQRRRWTLGATSNDLLLTFTRGTNWWERILAFSNVLTWCLNIFVLASLACMIRAFMMVPWFIIIAFASVMIIPLIYYICIAIWLPRNAVERAQYLIGLAIFATCGPFINISVLFYAVYNMDSFGWGKTRQVVTEETDNDSDTGISSLSSLGSRHLPDDEESQVVSEKPTRDTPFTASPGISGFPGSNSCREGGA